MTKYIVLCCLMLLALTGIAQNGENKTDAQGRKQGKWTARYPGGGVRYEGSFLDNQPVGNWKRYHDNGKLKATMYYRPKSAKVFATLFDDEGKMYAKGVFDGGIRDSIWNFYGNDKLIQTQNYLAGKKEGEGKAFDAEGNLIWQKSWKNDEAEGKCADFYPSGKKKNEIIYVAGKKSGVARFYDELGNVTMEGKYADDLSDGDWNIYGTDGKLKYQVKYEKGEVKYDGNLDEKQRKEFKAYDQMRGKIADPKESDININR